MSSIQPKMKKCKEGNHDAYLWSHGYCRYHWMMKTAKKQISEKKTNPDSKEVKDEKFFRYVWDNSEQVCQECGKVLNEFKRWYVHHILSKAKFPYFRYDIRNTIILCYQHHNEIESAISAPKLKVYPNCEDTKYKLLQEVGIDYESKITTP